MDDGKKLTHDEEDTIAQKIVVMLLMGKSKFKADNQEDDDDGAHG